MSITSQHIDSIPGEELLTKLLQQSLILTVGKKTIKQGKLIIFKQTHFCIQLTLQNTRNNCENIEIPIPFNTEYHPTDKLMYFDYRIKNLANPNSDLHNHLLNYSIKNIAPSQYFDKILEITIK